MKENDIIEKLRQGDETAFCELIDCYSGYVTAIICNLSRGMLSGADVEELAADVFAALWRSVPKLRQDAPLKPYLAQTARNAVRSRLRASRGEILPLNEQIAAGGNNPEEEAILREQTEIVNSAVETMEEPDREIFLRFYFFGERVGGIASRMELNLSTVKTKLRRARQKLCRKLEERGYSREKAQQDV